MALALVERGQAKCGLVPRKETAFMAAKNALAKAVLLVHPSSDAPIALTTDASDYAVGVG